MNKSTYFQVLVVFLLGALALSACGGAVNAQGISLNNLNPSILTGTVHPTESPELTGTPEAHSGQGTGTPEIETEKPEGSGTPKTEGTPEGDGTPEGHGTPGSDNSHEVLGVVTAISPNVSITINGITYDFTNQSVIHGSIVVGNTVRLTFGDSNGTLFVHEVKVTDANGSSDGQGNNGNSHEGGIRETGTPEPGNDGGGSGNNGSGQGGGG